MSNNMQESIRFGFTRYDPVAFGNGLPIRAPSTVNENSRFWTMLLEEYFCRVNSILSYYFTSAGSVHYSINGVEKGVFKIPPSQRKLWAVVEVHGKCSSIEFLDPNQTISELNNNLPSSQNAPHSSSQSSRIYNPFEPPSAKPSDGAQQFQPDLLISVRNALKGSKAQPQQNAVRTATVTSNSILSEVQQIGAVVENSVNQAVLNYVRNVQQQSTRSNFPESNYNRATLSLNQIKDMAKTRPTVNQVSSQPSTSGVSRNTLSIRNIELMSRRAAVRMEAQSLNSDRFRDRHEALFKNAATQRSSQTNAANGLGQLKKQLNTAQIAPSRTSALNRNTASSYMLPLIPPLNKSKPIKIAANIFPPDAVKFDLKDAISKSQQKRTPNKNLTNDGQENECNICFEKSIDAAVYKCGHMCMCFECATKLRRTNGFCPICRATIKDVLRIYKS